MKSSFGARVRGMRTPDSDIAKQPKKAPERLSIRLETSACRPSHAHPDSGSATLATHAPTATVNSFIHQHFEHFSPFQTTLWCAYLMAAVTLPLYHIAPVLKYRRGNGGIGDACIRTEAIQCAWRAPALLFSVFVVPSLPLFLSILLDMLGRIARVWAMHDSRRRFESAQASAAAAVARPEAVFTHPRLSLTGMP
jgi:hypothetical protein